MNQLANIERNTAEMIGLGLDSALPRLATVTGVKDRLVRVQFPEEAVGGETWYPTTELGVTVGMSGVVTRMRGNAAYFTPLGMPGLYTNAQVDALLAAAKPKTQRGVQNLNSTRTTAGDIDFTTVPGPTAAFVVGLQPNTAYQVTVDMFISMSTASTGSFRPVLKFPTGGTEQLSGFTPPLTTAINVHPWKWSGQVTSNANGEISAMPSARWVSGSITSSRAELVLRVEPA